MRLFNYIIFLLLSVTLFISCEDQVIVETDPAPVLLVVDGWITTEVADQTITLSRSQPYFDNTFADPVTGATVVVESSNGDIYNFIETDDGEYTWTAGTDSLGVVGTTFNLSIDVDGETYLSTSTVGRVPVIDSIGQEFEEDSFLGGAGVRTNFFARDPVGFGDTYWIKTFKNGDYLGKPEEINIAFDAGFDAGGQVDGLIYIPPIRDATNPILDDDDDDLPPWSDGDEIMVEIHSISNAAFFFMETARDQITNGSNGLFASPLSNTRGNVVELSTGELALGIFNVAEVSRIVDIIEE